MTDLASAHRKPVSTLPAMATVIVPAHNEEAVIAKTLVTLLDRGDPSAIQVVVVANGCDDGTAEVAALAASSVDVIEIAEASKVVAINVGEEAAPSFPRVYLDADVRLSSTSLQLILEALSEPGALIAEPTPDFDTSESSATVRAFYAVWVRLHGTGLGGIGSGVYAMSEAGRGRFGAFPPIIGDDAFVRAQFRSDEVIVVPGARSTVTAPRTTHGLLSITTRSLVGNRQLAARYPELSSAKQESSRGFVSKAIRLPLRLWALVPLYVGIQLWTRIRAVLLFRDFDEYRWERDDSSR